MTRPILVLVPTPRERDALTSSLQHLRVDVAVALCGFGPVVAAARAAGLIAHHHPRLVMLAGIAGTYSPSVAPVGAALEFGRVFIDGVGAGEGEHGIGPRAMGIPMWSGDGALEPSIWDEISCDAPDGTEHTLLTVCAASDSAACASRRSAGPRSPVAEDMEGFAVGCACAIAGVPFRVIRGISNVAGDRSRPNWRIDEALAAAAARLAQALEPRP